MAWLQNKFEKNFLITTVDYGFNWARKSAVWPMTFGLACCAIEMIASSTSRFDIARFGSILQLRLSARAASGPII
jgi:NADH-quinone oxidoreductase subunit B